MSIYKIGYFSISFTIVCNLKKKMFIKSDGQNHHWFKDTHQISNTQFNLKAIYHIHCLRKHLLI